MASQVNGAAELALEVRLQFSRRGARVDGFALDVDFRIGSGITILFGPSGAGKSTLLDCIAGLLKPESGRIALGSTVLQDSAAGVLLPPQGRQLAYLFQSPALFPHLSVEENVGFGLSELSKEERANRVREFLETFRVAHLTARKPAAISGGEAQRVALARALASSPRAVLLDEPLKGLDAELRSAIVDDLRSWNRARNLPILYVTHQRDEVDALGERVIALDCGRIVSEGAPHAVLDAPRKKRLAYAAGFENHLTGAVREIRQADGVMRVRLAESETELEVPLGEAVAGAQVQVAIRAGDILLATKKPEGLSARNILEGTVASVEPRGTIVLFRIDAGRSTFLVHVTPGAVRSLNLAAGQRVWLVIKTHSCHLVED